jgi:alcohol dehydrogenase (cytochrome c)
MDKGRETPDGTPEVAVAEALQQVGASFEGKTQGKIGFHGGKVSMAAAFFCLAFPLGALAQNADDLKKDATTPGAVLTYGMGYNQQRFSPLDKINRQTVKRLVPAWSYSTENLEGEEGQPLFKDGVVYFTTQDKTVAVDALTGREIWKTPVTYPAATIPEVCCGIVNRGATLYDGKLYRGNLDGNLVALDQKTGKEVWRAKVSDIKDGFTLTAAPTVVDGVVLTGVAGAELGIRGFIDGYDAETGEHLWRHYTVPAKGEKGSETWSGNSAEYGGGSTWTTGSYDPDLDLVFWGIGNPAPWDPLVREGDNLYTDSIMAIRPKTGEMVWDYQNSPHDPFDYDGVSELINADLTIDGQVHKVVLQANRNGIFYVLERATGKLLAANPYVKVTWADGVDLATGRPIWSAAFKAIVEKGAEEEIWPATTGGKNWFPMSFSPLTGLAYSNTLNFGMKYQPLPVDQVHLKVGEHTWQAIKKTAIYPENRGYLKAIDPMTGKAKWATPFAVPNYSGTMVTAGGLVFTGTLTGQFIAVDADTGKILWQFQTPSGIISQPISWEENGQQYVTVASGIGGVYALNAGDPGLAHVPRGGSLWTFKLMDE